MVALFSDSQPAAAFAFPAVLPSPSPVIGAAVNQSAEHREPPSPGLARLGDLLPQILERYGLDESPETNRPDIARGRRRVG